MCLARYKTRPGLTYHYNHSHKDRDLDGYSLPEPEEHAGSPSTGSDSLDAPPGSRGAYSGYPGPDHANLDEDIPRKSLGAGPAHQVKGGYTPSVYTPPGSTQRGSDLKKTSGSPAQDPVTMPAKPQSSGYCDFCLGDSNFNKKSMQPEELIGCSECGRSGLILVNNKYNP